MMPTGRKDVSKSPVKPDPSAGRAKYGQSVPADQPERDRLRRLTVDYVRLHRLLPPLGLADLSLHASRLLAETGTAPEYRDFLALLLHNALWCDEVAAIPFGKRLLLLPKCLRAKGKCQGVFDEIGLRCARCGRCSLDGLQAQAEKLGYAVLIAEGSPVVKTLLASGRIEAIVGVSCLPVLEQVFPFLEDGAIPSLAVPLLNDGCEDTVVDLDWCARPFCSMPPVPGPGWNCIRSGKRWRPGSPRQPGCDHRRSANPDPDHCP